MTTLSPPSTPPTHAARRLTFLADIARGILLFLSLLLLYTGFAKLADPSAFANILRAQGLLSADAGFVGWAVPLAELAVATLGMYAIAAALPALRFAGLAQAALFTAFTAYCAALWANPPRAHVPCGCGLSKSVVIDWSGPTMRAAILAALALAASATLHATNRRRP
jgi:hypothetical protein